jgi:hypothetical protein
MAKNRMAGEALTKNQRRRAARERIGNDPESLSERLSVVDRDAYDFGDYTDKEINMAMKGENFNESDYARLTRGENGNDGKPDNEVSIPTPVDGDPIPTPTPMPGQPVPSPSPGPSIPEMPPGLTGPGSQTQIVNQDNDQISNVTGNNNTVNQNQDNSVSQFGAYGTADRAAELRNRYVADVSRFMRN